MGAGVPANTGAAGARLRVGFFAGAPAPTEIAVRLTGRKGSKAVSLDRQPLPNMMGSRIKD